MEIRGGRREHFGAFGQGVDVVDSKHRQADVLLGVVVVPVCLASRWISESLPFTSRAWMNGYFDIGWKFENTFWCVWVKSLWVDSNVPDTCKC